MRENELDEEKIRERAYAISQLPDGGSAEENWIRAVDELRAERAEQAARLSASDTVSPFPPHTAALTHP